MNIYNIKRIFSCLSVLAVCLLANMGLEVKSFPIMTSTTKLSKSIQQDENFILYNGAETIFSENVKIADHYSHYSHSSHSSHYSHRSHYSSRY